MAIEESGPAHLRTPGPPPSTAPTSRCADGLGARQDLPQLFQPPSPDPSSPITSGGAIRTVGPWVSLTRTPRASSRSETSPPGADRPGDVHPGPQPAPPHRRHPAGAGQLAQHPVQPLAQPRRPLLVLPVRSIAITLQRHRASQRIRRTSTRARPAGTPPSTAALDTTRRHRHDPAAQRLAQHVHVRHDPLVLCTRRLRPVRPSPDWISSATKRTFRSRVSSRTPGQIAGRRHDHPGLALDRLQQHRHRVLRQRRPHRRQVAVRHDLEPPACTDRSPPAPPDPWRS